MDNNRAFFLQMRTISEFKCKNPDITFELPITFDKFFFRSLNKQIKSEVLQQILLTGKFEEKKKQFGTLKFDFVKSWVKRKTFLAGKTSKF